MNDMTPEELNRTIEFLVRHQAEFSVDLQRDHEMLNKGFEEMHKGFAEMHKGFAEMRVEMHKGFAEMWQGIAELQKSMKRLAGVEQKMAVSQERTAELIEIGTRRLDQEHCDHKEFQVESQRRHEEILAQLNEILRKLTGNNPKPN